MFRRREGLAFRRREGSGLRRREGRVASAQEKVTRLVSVICLLFISSGCSEGPWNGVSASALRSFTSARDSSPLPSLPIASAFVSSFPLILGMLFSDAHCLVCWNRREKSAVRACS